MTQRSAFAALFSDDIAPLLLGLSGSVIAGPWGERALEDVEDEDNDPVGGLRRGRSVSIGAAAGALPGAYGNDAAILPLEEPLAGSADGQSRTTDVALATRGKGGKKPQEPPVGDAIDNYAEPRLAQQEAAIEPLLGSVEQQDLRAHVATLANLDRASETGQEAAVSYIRQQLESYGYAVSLDPIRDGSPSPGNLIARRIGAVHPDIVFVVGAHYDAKAIPEEAGSPGADDNASGVAGTLEIARALRAFQPDATIEFVFFGAEEKTSDGDPGRDGSRQYAADAAAAGTLITGMVALEMIGYTSDDSKSQVGNDSDGFGFVDVEGVVSFSEQDREVGDFLAAVGNTTSSEFLAAYGTTAAWFDDRLPLVTAETVENGEKFPDVRRSDHAAFWDEGYEALLLTDTSEFRNPNYHLPSDTPDTLDYGFMQQVTRATLAAAVITTSVLVVEGSRKDDRLEGTSRADDLRGGRGDDTLIGLASNDRLDGGPGADLLIGTNPQAPSPGARELDRLIGGGGPDTFVLGDEGGSFYLGGGATDLAVIEDLGSIDRIRLHGSADDIVLVAAQEFEGRTGTAILLTTGTTGAEIEELIGFAVGAGPTLVGSALEFVGSGV